MDKRAPECAPRMADRRMGPAAQGVQYDDV